MIVPLPFDTPDQLDLSRSAADRYVHLEAARAAGVPHRSSVPVLNRVRHALASWLMSTARVIDAR